MKINLLYINNRNNSCQKRLNNYQLHDKSCLVTSFKSSFCMSNIKFKKILKLIEKIKVQKDKNLIYSQKILDDSKEIRKDVILNIKEGIKSKYETIYDEKKHILKEFLPSYLHTPRAYYINEYLNGDIFRKTFFVNASPVEIVEYFNANTKSTKGYPKKYIFDSVNLTFYEDFIVNQPDESYSAKNRYEFLMVI